MGCPRRPSPFNILTSRPGRRSSPGTRIPRRAPAQNPIRHAQILRRLRPEGDARELSGRFRRDDWQGALHRAAHLSLRRNHPALLSTPRASAYIKIAEGCDHPCTFCVIPNLRGKFRSRRFESVVAEAEQLVARGVREITLIGQDTTCYGEDLGLKDGLATLLDALARIRRPPLAPLPLRLSQPHHRQAARHHRRHDNICKYLDLPLQHASPASSSA
jgi:ribosomal protein S12 methylthiotransferase